MGDEDVEGADQEERDESDGSGRVPGRAKRWIEPPIVGRNRRCEQRGDAARKPDKVGVGKDGREEREKRQSGWKRVVEKRPGDYRNEKDQDGGQVAPRRRVARRRRPEIRDGRRRVS